MLALLSTLFDAGPVSPSFSMTAGFYDAGAGSTFTGYSNQVAFEFGSVTPSPVRVGPSTLKRLSYADGSGLDYLDMEIAAQLPAYFVYARLYINGVYNQTLTRVVSSATYLGETGNPFVDGVTYAIRLEFSDTP